MLVVMSEKGSQSSLTSHSTNARIQSKNQDPVIQTTADLITDIEAKNFFHSERDKQQGSFMLDMEAWATVLDLKMKLCAALVLEKTLPDGTVYIDCPEP